MGSALVTRDSEHATIMSCRLPAFWVVANFFEWSIHKFPMHRPLRPRILYTNHTLIHHRAFQEHCMAVRDRCELSIVMMPWYTLLFVFLSGAPVAIGLALLGGSELAGVFVVAAVSYFMLYETAHALYHLPPALLSRTGLARRKWFMSARGNHAHHHGLERMYDVNFNVTFPLADWVLGTYKRPDDEGAV